MNRTAKEFTIKVILSLLPLWAMLLSLWLYVWLCPMKYMDGEYPYWMQQRDYVHKNTTADDIITLGDSTMKAAVRPSLVPDIKIANLAVGGGTTVESYYALRSYIKNHGAPRLAVIGYHAIHYTMTSCNITRTLYFNYLTVPELRDVRRNAQALQDPYWDAVGIDGKIISYKIRSPVAYTAPLIAVIKGNREQFNLSAYQRLEHNRGWMTFGNDNGFYGKSYIVSWQDFAPNALIDLYLHRIMDLCVAQNIRLVLVQMPIPADSLRDTDDAVRRKIESYFEQLQSAYPAFIIHSGLTGFDNSLFGDMNHLNERGAEQFTNMLAKELHELQ